jgi:D-glycero-D-manno-heptose 1,7-bisphosphate phosphatase
MSKRAVFLDRDGVINGYVYNAEVGTVDSPSNPSEFSLLPGVAGAVATFRHLGLLTIVVSNQPGIAKGKFREELLEQMTDKMVAALGMSGARVDDVWYCVHHPQASVPEYRVNCSCRKPKPGLLLGAAEKWGIDLVSSYMVGDGIADMQAGTAAGTRTLFVNSRKCYLCEELARQGVQPDYFVASAEEAATVIRGLELGEHETVRQFLPGGCFSHL